ncbi:MAG: sigma-70 family RNA polymerase sigma factor [Planctomycetales bacterium]|nr:sigma-70 family RNA polymerase sigma factor [Planctomycetales bacterium]
MSSRSSSEQLVEHMFRHESANLIAGLTRVFGVRMIDVIEDAVQDAMFSALKTWRLRGVPEQPQAWLRRVAQNRMIDLLRHQRLEQQILAGKELLSESHLIAEPPWIVDELDDNLLRLIFVCCHPGLERDSQLALCLKLLCGFGNQELGRALLIPPETAKKRVNRAKLRLKDLELSFDLPDSHELDKRLEVVHDVLYLMFNEGYSTTRGLEAIQIDVCEDAARLCHILCEHPLGNSASYALLALMLFHAARFESRVTSSGTPVLLDDQDRSSWDQDMIRVGQYWLLRSGQGTDLSRFHFEASIAWQHCVARSYAETNWHAIEGQYRLLNHYYPNPLHQLNRAIVLARLGRLELALEIVRNLSQDTRLDSYPLLYCVWADLLLQLGQPDSAVQHWKTALPLVQSEHERQLITTRISKYS